MRPPRSATLRSSSATQVIDRPSRSDLRGSPRSPHWRGAASIREGDVETVAWHSHRTSGFLGYESPASRAAAINQIQKSTLAQRHRLEQAESSTTSARRHKGFLGGTAFMPSPRQRGSDTCRLRDVFNHAARGRDRQPDAAPPAATSDAHQQAQPSRVDVGNAREVERDIHRGAAIQMWRPERLVRAVAQHEPAACAQDQPLGVLEGNKRELPFSGQRVTSA